MNFLRNKFDLYLLMAICSMVFFYSCGEDDGTGDELSTASYEYELHNGQAVPTAPYGGFHPNDFGVTMDLEELDNGNTMITLTLENTIIGATYHIHAHDAADAASTPNGTPYDETPNASIFQQMVDGASGSVEISQEAEISFDELTTEYEGFFVVHDPLQSVSTTDISTYLVVGSFGRAQAATSYASSTYEYDFNVGQVADVFAYAGSHDATLTASIQVDELAEGARVTVRLENTLDGQSYFTHAHDMADPATTPNGTPYNETPNSDVLAGEIVGTGGMAALVNISSLSYEAINDDYSGFFVVHDPLQAVSTTDPTTYVILGVFAE